MNIASAGTVSENVRHQIDRVTSDRKPGREVNKLANDFGALLKVRNLAESAQIMNEAAAQMTGGFYFAGIVVLTVRVDDSSVRAGLVS